VLDGASAVNASIIRDNLSSDNVGASALDDGVSDLSVTLTYETDD